MDKLNDEYKCILDQLEKPDISNIPEKELIPATIKHNVAPYGGEGGGTVMTGMEGTYEHTVYYSAEQRERIARKKIFQKALKLLSDGADARIKNKNGLAITDLFTSYYRKEIILTFKLEEAVLYNAGEEFVKDFVNKNYPRNRFNERTCASTKIGLMASDAKSASAKAFIGLAWVVMGVGAAIMLTYVGAAVLYVTWPYLLGAGALVGLSYIAKGIRSTCKGVKKIITGEKKEASKWSKPLIFIIASTVTISSPDALKPEWSINGEKLKTVQSVSLKVFFTGEDSSASTSSRQKYDIMRRLNSVQNTKIRFRSHSAYSKHRQKIPSLVK